MNENEKAAEQELSKDIADLKTAVIQVVESSKQENQLKKAELEVRRAEIESQERLALASIDANKQHHKEHYSLYNKHLVNRYWFIGSLVIATLIFASFAINAGAQDLVTDLTKLILGTGIGAFGGYHYGKSKQKDG